MDRKQADSSGGGRLRGDRYSKKEKELMDMDNSVVIVGVGEYKETKSQWEKIQ